MKAFLQVASLAIFIRTVLIIYGEWQDHFLEVKYTDVDYWVVSDAAVALLTGKSPFIRSTFRYTPMLATLLIPNVYLGNCFGKFLFASFDLLAGYFIYLFLLRSTNSTRAAKLVGVFWLLNPMVFTISTRGNCESILCTLILASIYFLTSKRILLGGLFYGLAVHFRLFPVIYGVAILSYIMTGKLRRSITSSPPISPRATIYPPLNGEDVIKSSTPLTSPNSSPNDSPKLKNRKKRQDLTSQKPNNATVATPHQRINSVNLTSTANRFWSLLLFSISSLVAFGLPTGLSYKVFGAEYLQEALLYHLTRKDHRHNFSPYFYLFYTDAVLKLPQNFELFVFLPQFLVFIMAGIKFGRKDLAYSCFIITFIFVTFNKVITSQYFVWYLSLFPMAYVSLHNISTRRWMLMSSLWFGAQAIWLNLAYKLEFLGMNVFTLVWAASILFLLVNVWISGQFIRHRFVPEILHAGPGIITLNNTAL